MSKGQRQKQKQRTPDTVVADFYPLIDLLEPAWLDRGDLKPEEVAKVVLAGDEIQKRLQWTATILAKLMALGWSPQGDLQWINLYKETTREEAMKELSQLHIDPEWMSLQAVVTDEEVGWRPVGRRIRVPKRPIGTDSISVRDLNRMRANLDLMERILEKERGENSKSGTKGKGSNSVEAREEKLVKNNDILLNALRIVSTFLEETLAQPDIRRDSVRP